MKLTWVKTGDSIELDILNQEIFEYVLDFWNTKNQNIFYPTSALDIDSVFNELVDSLNKTNKLLEHFKINDLCEPVSLNQDHLNTLHEKWVMLGRKHPYVGQILEKKEKGGDFHFDNINEKIHELETLFEIVVYNLSTMHAINNFGLDITSFDFCNISLVHKNLGRRTFNKWQFFDKSVHNIDRNDFMEFNGYIKINLNRPYSVTPPKEYVDWCNQNNLGYPSGVRVKLANFKNLEENLTTYRELFKKNFSDIENGIVFK